MGGYTTPAVSTTSMESRYVVSLKKTDEGYSVWVPGLPGCWSQGSNEEEALDNIRDAIREYVSVARELASDGEVREVALSI
jgi:predicted RNase H-like HicB family nuclease